VPAAHLDFCLQVSLTVEPRELPLVQLPAPPLPSELRGQFQPPRRATSAREPPTHSWVRRVSRSHPRGKPFLLMILPSTWGIPIRVGLFFYQYSHPRGSPPSAWSPVELSRPPSDLLV
jgi:hypothetical protein